VTDPATTVARMASLRLVFLSRPRRGAGDPEGAPEVEPLPEECIVCIGHQGLMHLLVPLRA
jgi:hypothetical protein